MLLIRFESITKVLQVADSNFSPGEEDTDSSDDSDAEAASETRRQKQKTKTLPKRLAPLRDVAARHRKKGEAKAEKMTVQVRYNLATKLEGSERENILHLFNALSKRFLFKQKVR